MVKEEVQAQTSEVKSDKEILTMSKPAVYDDSGKDNEDFTMSDHMMGMPENKGK